MAEKDDSKMIEERGSQSFDLESKSTSSSQAPQNPFKAGVKLAQSSNIQASLTLFKGFIGTGVLALPYAFKTAGLGLSILVLVFVAFLTGYCFMLLLDVVNDKIGTEKVSLQKLTMDILGNKGKHAVQVSMLVMQLGCCTGILIFTKNFINHILCEFGISSLCDNTVFSVFFCLMLTVPLCMINNMHYFYIPSLTANFFILIGLASQMYYNLQVLEQDPTLKSNTGTYLKEFNLLDLPLLFGIATFAFEAIGIIFSIRSSMEKPQDFPFILRNIMAILSIIYIVFPAVCLITFGERLPDIIFFTLPTDDPFYLLIQILYAISALFTFPVQLFPALRIMENSKNLRFRLFNERGKCINKKLRYGLRLAVIGLVFLVAYSANSFHLFLNLLGSCVFTFVGFILPVWVYQTYFKGRINKKKSMINYSVVAISGFFGVTGFIMSLSEMAKGGEAHHE